MDALVISPFHDSATSRSSLLARLVLTVLRREGYEVFTLEGDEVTRDKLHALLESRAKKDKPPFSLVFYAGHGLAACLIGQENHTDAPLLDEDNIMMLAGAVIISISCRSGKELGKDSIKKGVKGFIGFNSDVYLPESQVNGRDFQGDFLRSFLILPLLMSKGHPIGHVVNEYKELVKGYIDKYTTEQPLFWEDAKAWSNNNLVGILYHGNPSITLEPRFVF